MLVYNPEDILLVEAALYRCSDSVRHSPLSAGMDSQGRKLQLGITAHCHLCTSVEGVRSAKYINDGVQLTTKGFWMMVLRHDPSESDTTQYWPASMDTAGQMHWRKLTTKGKLQLEKGFFAPSFEEEIHIAARRSGEFVEMSR